MAPTFVKSAMVISIAALTGSVFIYLAKTEDKAGNSFLDGRRIVAACVMIKRLIMRLRRLEKSSNRSHKPGRSWRVVLVCYAIVVEPDQRHVASYLEGCVSHIVSSLLPGATWAKPPPTNKSQRFRQSDYTFPRDQLRQIFQCLRDTQTLAEATCKFVPPKRAIIFGWRCVPVMRSTGPHRWKFTQIVATSLASICRAMRRLPPAVFCDIGICPDVICGSDGRRLERQINGLPAGCDLVMLTLAGGYLYSNNVIEYHGTVVARSFSYCARFQWSCSICLHSSTISPSPDRPAPCWR